MATLGDLTADFRAHVDESVAKFWTPDEVTRWLNEGARDVARRAKCILDTDIQDLVANQALYNAPADAIQVYAVEFLQATGFRIQLEYLDYGNMDTIWLTSRDVAGATPAYWTSWGFTGTNVKAGRVAGQQIRLYPIPSAAYTGGLTLYYYRLPVPMAKPGDFLEVPAGWEDCVVLYAEFTARRKDNDPRWQDASKLYEARLEELVAVTRRLSDQAETMHMVTSSWPAWAPGGDEW